MVALGTEMPVPRGAQGHDLADRDGDVGFLRFGEIAPTALIVLRVNDELHRALERLAHVFAVAHAVHFREERRGEPVAVHRAVIVVGPLFHDVAVGARAGEHVVRDACDVLAIGSAAGGVPAGQKRHPAQADDAGVPAIDRQHAERSIILLPRRQPRETRLDRDLRRRRDHAPRVARTGLRLLGRHRGDDPHTRDGHRE
jgi:hypothetical protein